MLQVGDIVRPNATRLHHLPDCGDYRLQVVAVIPKSNAFRALILQKPVGYNSYNVGKEEMFNSTLWEVVGPEKTKEDCM